MAYFQENISETEFVLCPEHCGNYDEFQEDWAPTTVGTAVTQGKKLRDCKPSAQLHNEYQVGIDCVKPCQEIRSHRKSNKRSCYDICNSPSTKTYSPPCGFCSSGSWAKTYKKSQSSLSRQKQCSLRIIELAAPTKRHCLETWKSNAHILPDYMLNRIRQHVMDEKPIAQIPDALNCFKRRVSTKRSSRSRKFKVSDACMSDISRYSAVFAHCVAQKLDKPFNITLNPKLEKILRIVSYEMGRMSSTKSKNSKNNTKNKKNKFEKQIQDEMSKKVTAWIEDVLKDTSEKLLQDALRELEEEEGPVLDIIDDLIDNVVTSYEPEEDHKTPNQTPEDIKTAPALISEAEGGVIDEETDDENENKKADNDDVFSMENYLTQVINTQLDTIISKGEDELSTVNFGSRPEESETKSTDNTNNVTNTNILNESIHSVTGNTNILTDTIGEVSLNKIDGLTDDKDTGIEYIKKKMPSDISYENVVRDIIEGETKDKPGKVDENYLESDDIKGNNLKNDTSYENVIEDIIDEESKDEPRKVEENYVGSDNEKENYLNNDTSNKNVVVDIINEETKDEPRKVEENYVKSDDGKENILNSDMSNENVFGDIIDDDTKDEPGNVEENNLESDDGKENNLNSAISNENEIGDIIDEETKHEPGKIEENHVESDGGKENNSNTNDETGGTANVSSLYTNSEESLDDLSKTVKFSKVDDGFGRIVDIIGSQKLVFINWATGITKIFGDKNNLVFTSSKENLLSDADEPWPSDISTGGRKLTNSVSKSVISLGPLYENAEEKQTIDESSLKETDFDNTLDMLGIRNEENKFKKLTSDQIDYLETGVEHRINEVSDKEKNILYKLEYSAKNKEETKHLEDDTSVQIFDDTVLPNKKVNYKVDTKSAPSWLVSDHCDKGKGEPDDSILKRDQKNKYEMSEVHLRKWIENLEIMSENLLIWNEWIKTTCRTVKHIKRKSERIRSRCTNTYRHKDIDYWLKLEKYVYKDARMWLKLKHRAKKQLKAYDCNFRHKQYDAEIQTIKCKC